MTPFEKHMTSHFASLLALQGARESGCPENLEGMIKAALVGTWNAALDSAIDAAVQATIGVVATVVDQEGRKRITEKVLELRAQT